MASEKGRNREKKKQKKIERLKLLSGIDLCACGGGHRLRCHGVCKEAHTNSKTREIECSECYQIECNVKPNDPRRQKRTWKYGRQKDGDENKLDKQRRREKWERNRSKELD